MKNKWNRRAAALAAAALILTAGTAVGQAIAYFTVNVTAEGGKELALGSVRTEPWEEMKDGMKIITIKNTGESDCYVRVKAFAGVLPDEGKELFTFLEGEGGSDPRWVKSKDGWFYWTDILPMGADGNYPETGVLKLKINSEEAIGDHFNVIVVQECTPVPYDNAGNPVSWKEVDWNRKTNVVKDSSVDTKTSGEGNE